MDDIKTMLAAGHKIAYFETWTWNGSYIWLEKPEVIVDDPIIYNRSEMMEYWANN